MLDGPARLATAAAQVAAKRRAATAVGSSAALRAVLVATLDMGNFLNHGGRGGQAAGYQLETLLRLSLGCTLAALLPPCALLLRAPSRRAFLLCATACGLAFFLLSFQAPPRCGRDAAEMRPRCGRGAAEMRPRVAEMRPRCCRGEAFR